MSARLANRDCVRSVSRRGLLHTPPTKLKYTKTHILLVHILLDREGKILKAFSFNSTTWRRLSGVFFASEVRSLTRYTFIKKMIIKLMMIVRIIIIYFFKSLLFMRNPVKIEKENNANYYAARQYKSNGFFWISQCYSAIEPLYIS